MTRILVFSHSLELGGVERALIGLLESVDYDNYSIDLFLMRHEGELMNDVPKEVNILPAETSYSTLAVKMSVVIKKNRFDIAVRRLKGKLKSNYRIKELGFGKDNNVPLIYSHQYTLKKMCKINPSVTYDIAISFLTPHFAVLEKVNALRKIAWIHTDYSSVQLDVETELPMWGRYDKIVAVSETTKKNFIKNFPILEDKVIVKENLLPKRIVAIRAEENYDVIYNMMHSISDICLLSVGRFAYAKNFDNVPDICARLHDFGIHVKWFLIGYGGDEELIRTKIIENKMENNVIILGAKSNPYPYMKACDYYIQPSRYEGRSVSVMEAQALDKTVIITNYPSAKDQIVDGEDGFIVPIDNAGCAKGIYDIIVGNHKPIRSTKSFSNESKDVLADIVDDNRKIPLTIMTPTYNRSETLTRLFESLQSQTSQAFEWIVVDDGSTDDTKELLSYFKTKASFDMSIIHQARGGKHRAINNAIYVAKGEIFCIVDSDDYLFPESVNYIIREWRVHGKEAMGMIFRSRDKKTKKMVGVPFPSEPIYSNFIDISFKLKVGGDKCEVFETAMLRRNLFPVFKGEYFCTEALWLFAMSKKERKKLYCSNKELQWVDYRPDGLSRNMRKVISENPNGMLHYYMFMLSLKEQWKYPMQILHHVLKIVQLWLCVLLKKGENDIYVPPVYVGEDGSK